MGTHREAKGLSCGGCCVRHLNAPDRIQPSSGRSVNNAGKFFVYHAVSRKMSRNTAFVGCVPSAIVSSLGFAILFAGLCFGQNLDDYLYRGKIGTPTTACKSDADCGAGGTCFVQVPELGGFCIPHHYVFSDADDAHCTYRVNCSAAEALRKLCPGCYLEPIVACRGSSVTQDEAENLKKRLRATCLKPTSEQKHEWDAVHRKMVAAAKRWQGCCPPPALDPSVQANDWLVDPPLPQWPDDTFAFQQSKEQIQRLLYQTRAFNPVCPTLPTFGRDGWTAVAGTCGVFRNPDPSSVPPVIIYERPLLRTPGPPSVAP